MVLLSDTLQSTRDRIIKNPIAKYARGGRNMKWWWGVLLLLLLAAVVVIGGTYLRWNFWFG
jgi:ABC-type multidrug transport system permease subunit